MEETKQKQNFQQKETQNSISIYLHKLQLFDDQKSIIQILNENNYKINQENYLENVQNNLHFIQMKGMNKHNLEVLIKVSDGSQESYELLKGELEIKQKLQLSYSILHTLDQFLFEENKICILIYEWSNQTLYQHISSIKEIQEHEIEEEIQQTKFNYNLFLNLIKQLQEYNLMQGIVIQINPHDILKYSDGQYKFSSSVINSCSVELLSRYQNIFDLNDRNRFYIPPELLQGESSYQYLSQFSSIYSLGVIFLELIGICIDEQTLLMIRQKEYQKLCSKQCQIFQQFIRFFMINKKPKNRCRAICLQVLLLEKDIGQFIDFELESKKTQEIIVKYEQQNRKQDLYLANSFYYLSLTTQTVDQIKYWDQAIQIMSDLDLKRTVNYLFFSKLKADDLEDIEQITKPLINDEKPLILYAKFQFINNNSYLGSLDSLRNDIQDIQLLIKNPNHPFQTRINCLLASLEIDIQDIQEFIEAAFPSFPEYFLEYIQEYLIKTDFNQIIQTKIDLLKKLISLCTIYKGINLYELAFFYSSLGIIQNQNRDLDDGLDSLNKTIEYLQRYYKTDKHKYIAQVLRKIGFNYLYRGDFEKALEYDLQVLQMNEDINDEEGVLESLQDVCISYSKIKQFNKAIYYRQKKLKLLQMQKNQGVMNPYYLSMAEDIYRIAILFWKDEQYYQAVYYLKRALQLEISKSNRIDRIQQCFQDIQNVYLTLKDSEESELFYIKQLKFK